MLICYYVLFVNMFLRPFGSKRLRESYVFKITMSFKKKPSTLGSEKGSYFIF